MTSLEAWLLNVDGRKIDRDGGFPAKDPYQCWDLWADYAERVVGVPIADTFTNRGGAKPHSGYACNVFHNAHAVPAIASRFIVLGPGATAEPGDVAFWEKGGLYAGSHVAIVIADRGNALYCMSQNKGPTLDAAAFETLSKRTLLGYLRPRTKTSAPAPKPRPTGALMALSDPEQDRLLALVEAIRREQVEEDGIAQRTLAASTETRDALLKPNRATGIFKPIDYLISHVKSTFDQTRKD